MLHQVLTRFKRSSSAPFEVPVAGPSKDQLLEFVRAAAIAPSGHNTQPWKFRLLPEALELHPDFSLRLPVVDPDDRELWISLGCALENLILAAEHLGFSSHITYPASPSGFIGLRFTPGASEKSPDRFAAMRLRQTNRATYSGAPLTQAQLDQISSIPTGPYAAFMVLKAKRHLESLVGYVQEGNSLQFADPLFLQEIITWSRFNRDEAEMTKDGLYSAAMGFQDTSRPVGIELLESIGVSQRNRLDEKFIQTSTGCLLFASAKDDLLHWIETGRVYQRVCLSFVSMGLYTAFLNQPVEIPVLRAKLDAEFKLTPYTSQLLLRFGYANPLPRSFRRPIEQLLLP